jgi:hypothetical protein
VPLGYTFGERTKEILDELVDKQKVGKNWVNKNADIGLSWAKPLTATTIKTRG